MIAKICLSCKVYPVGEYIGGLLNLQMYTITLIALGLVGDNELEDFDTAAIQSRIDEELTTDISSTGTQCHVFRCPSKSSIK